MASARQLPVDYNESTYGSGAEDYSSLVTWESDTDTDLVTATKGEILTCSAGVYDDSVTISGATVNSSYFRIIRGAVGTANSTSGVRFETSSTTADYGMVFFTFIENYFGLYDVGISGQSNGTGNAYVYGVDATARYYTNLKFIGLFIYDCDSTAGTVGIYTRDLVNPIIVDTVVTGITADANDQTGLRLQATTDGKICYVYNCTILGCAREGIYGYSRDAGETLTLYLKNTILQNNAADINSAGSGTFTINETTNAKSAGVTFDADGYHLDSSDTVAKDQGTDLSGAAPENESVYPFDDDIDGDTRSGTWDIGADEYVSAVSALNLRTLMGAGI